VFEKNLEGLHYGNRLILPFHCIFLKVVINREIITDFSSTSKFINVVEGIDYTDLYFREYENIKETLSKFESIKMVVVEKNKTIFDFKNHVKLVVYLEDKHKLKIEKTNEDFLFIE
jgi:hypothetical protein